MAEEKKKTSEVSLWDPFREDFFRGWPFGRLSNRLVPFLEEAGTRWAPALDIVEDDDRYVITVELAGAKRDDVHVELHGNTLTIRGEKRSEREEKKEQRRYVERTYGSFARSFTLPENANGEKVNASFKEGVLTVEIPKREESKPQAIAVK